MGLFGKKFKPPYASGYELGLNGTSAEIDRHLGFINHEFACYEEAAYQERLWQKDVGDDILRGAGAALQAGRPQNLAQLISGRKYRENFCDALEEVTVDQFKAMHLSQKNLYSIAYGAIMSSNLVIMQRILDAGLDVHYDNEYMLRDAARLGRETIMILLVKNGANIEDAYYYATIKNSKETGDEIKARLRAFQAKTTGKTALGVEDRILEELKEQKSEILQRLEKKDQELCAKDKEISQLKAQLANKGR